MNPHNLDIRTLLLLMVEHDLPKEQTFNLIAQEIGVPADKLIAKVATPEEAPTRSKRVQWNQETLDELVRMWNDGAKPSTIAKTLGCSTQTVYQQISRLRKERTDIVTRQSKNPHFATQKA